MERLRRLAASLPPPRPELDAYLARVRTGAYAITDDEMAALHAAGVSDDELFEQTVRVALGEGLRRFDAGLGTLERR